MHVSASVCVCLEKYFKGMLAPDHIIHQVMTVMYLLLKNEIIINYYLTLL